MRSIIASAEDIDLHVRDSISDSDKGGNAVECRLHHRLYGGAASDLVRDGRDGTARGITDDVELAHMNTCRTL